MTLHELSDIPAKAVRMSPEAQAKEDEIILKDWAETIRALTEHRAERGETTNVIAQCAKIRECWRGFRGANLYRKLREHPEIMFALGVSQQIERAKCAHSSSG